MNKLGKVANKYWKEIPKHYPDVRLDEYIIMPNHVHGILLIEKEARTQYFVQGRPQGYAPTIKTSKNNLGLENEILDTYKKLE